MESTSKMEQKNTKAPCVKNKLITGYRALKSHKIRG